LHSALGYITPKDMLEGRQQEIFAERERKLIEARQRRRGRREALSDHGLHAIPGDLTLWPSQLNSSSSRRNGSGVCWGATRQG